MNGRRLFPHSTSLFIVLLLLLGCSAGQPSTTPISPTATQAPVTPTASPATVSASVGPDYWPTHGWRITTPEEQGVDSEILARMLGFIQEQEHDIHSVTVVRNGYLILDASFYPFEQHSMHTIHSCTKSITSAMIGIAIEQGFIEDVEQPVLSYFPDRTAANLNGQKGAMTLEDLLTMASGLECRDSFLYEWRGLNEMWQTDDWIQFVLDLPMAEAPGTRFEYCNGASLLLAAIIQETTGSSAATFAQDNLFNPLGISDVVWPANPQGITIGWGGLRIRPHDMAKIGYLYLNKGQWDGRQIIPSDWVAVSTSKHIAATVFDGYGYQWWVPEDDIYLALGSCGQYIVVAPELELVVVFASNLCGDDLRIPYRLLNNFIIPAANPTIPIASNPTGLQMLESKLQQVALNPTEPEPVPSLPETAQTITGDTYALDPNLLGLVSITLTFQEETEAFINWTANSDDSQLYLSAPNWWNQADWQVGLDNVYRFTPGAYGLPMGAKGRWLSADTFILYNDLIGNTGKYELRFNFAIDELSLVITKDGRSLPAITGRLES